jgi:general secretion pathway protein I
VTASAQRSDEGFTLIEVVVALAILGMSLTLLFAIFSESLARERKNEVRGQERALAQSLLQRALLEPVRNESGMTDQGFAWRVAYAPYGSQDDTRSWPNSAWELTVIVGDSSGAANRVTLHTLRLGAKEPLQ